MQRKLQSKVLVKISAKQHYLTTPGLLAEEGAARKFIRQRKMENTGLWRITVECKVNIISIIRHDAYASSCWPAGANDPPWNSGLVLGSLFGAKNNGIDALTCIDLFGY